MSTKSNDHRKLDKASLLAEIQNGTAHVVSVYIPALKGELQIRPLSSGELAELMPRTARGLALSFEDMQRLAEGKAEGLKLDVNVEDMMRAQGEAIFELVATGLTIDGSDAWTVDDVRALRPASAVHQLSAEIMRISEIQEADLSPLRAFLR